MNNKKGAMFGLDARIALAIFGALSVISGAALYSAIQDSKSVSAIVELNEVGKAWESYYIDTASFLHRTHPSVNDSDYRSRYLKTSMLESNSESITGWKGPYFNSGVYMAGDILASGISISDNIYGHISDSPIYAVQVKKTTSWYNYSNSLSACDTECYIAFVAIYKNNSLCANIDIKVDGGDGNLTGNIRYNDTSSSNYCTLTYIYSNYTKR